MNTIYNEKAKMYKAFCDENRLMILELLSHGETCACVIQNNLNVSQSTVSHHMKILCESGIVTGRKEGKWMFYSLNDKGCFEAIDYINVLLHTEKSKDPIVGENYC